MKILVFYALNTYHNTATVMVRPDWGSFSINECREDFKQSCFKWRNFEPFRKGFHLRFTRVEASKPAVAREIVEAACRTLGYDVVRKHSKI